MGLVRQRMLFERRCAVPFHGRPAGDELYLHRLDPVPEAGTAGGISVAGPAEPSEIGAVNAVVYVVILGGCTG